MCTVFNIVQNFLQHEENFISEPISRLRDTGIGIRFQNKQNESWTHNTVWIFLVFAIKSMGKQSWNQSGINFAADSKSIISREHLHNDEVTNGKQHDFTVSTFFNIVILKLKSTSIGQRTVI